MRTWVITALITLLPPVEARGSGLLRSTGGASACTRRAADFLGTAYGVILFVPAAAGKIDVHAANAPPDEELASCARRLSEGLIAGELRHAAPGQLRAEAAEMAARVGAPELGDALGDSMTQGMGSGVMVAQLVQETAVVLVAARHGALEELPPLQIVQLSQIVSLGLSAYEAFLGERAAKLSVLLAILARQNIMRLAGFPGE